LLKAYGADQPFNPAFHLCQMAEKLEKTLKANGGCHGCGTVLEAPVVVLAAGGGSFVPKKMPIKGIEAYEANPSSTPCVKWTRSRANAL
jgi:thioredoxin reductase (NADPH)